MIVALLNQKGGVGKTTLATHIAGELAMRGLHVILLDADPQGSSLDWTQRRSQQGLPRLFSVVGLARETLHQEAPELARRADHVITNDSGAMHLASFFGASAVGLLGVTNQQETQPWFGTSLSGTGQPWPCLDDLSQHLTKG